MPSKETHKLYDMDSLKLTEVDVETHKVIKEPKRFLKGKDEGMSHRKSLLVIVMLVVMYAMASALPTFLLMHFLSLPFWQTQIVCVILLNVIVFAFGLHKPASNQQKLKSKFLI